MKLKLMTLLFAFAVVFTGCKKDDEEVDPNLALLVGTWVYSSQTTTSCTDSEYEGVDNCTSDCDELTVTSDGKYKVVKVSEKMFVGKNLLHIAVFKKNDERLHRLIGKDDITNFYFTFMSFNLN